MKWVYELVAGKKEQVRNAAVQEAIETLLLSVVAPCVCRRDAVVQLHLPPVYLIWGGEGLKHLLDISSIVPWVLPPPNAVRL